MEVWNASIATRTIALIATKGWMMGRTCQICGFLICAYWAGNGRPIACHGNETLAPGSSLARFQTSLRDLNQMSADVTTKYSSSGVPGKFEGRDIDTSVTIYRDGDRLDMRGVMRQPKGVQSYQFHGVAANGKWVYYQAEIGQKPTLGAFSERMNEFFAQYLYSPHHGMALHGFLPRSDGRNVADLMLEATDLPQQGSEKVGDAACEVWRGETPYGVITLWLTDASIPTLCKATYDKGPAHIYVEGKTISEQPPSKAMGGEQVVGVRYVLDQLRISRVGERLAPTHGVLTSNYLFASGNSSRETITYDVKNFTLNPDFAARSAFTVNLPEGTRVSDLDHPESGVHHLWHQQEVKVAGAEFGVIDVDEGGWGSGKALFLWGAIGAAFIAASGWLYVRSSRR